jgi:tetratricopeptide (TPR) repeat protein
MRRLAHRLGRAEEAVRANTALAELTTDAKAKSRYFVEAAELVAGAGDGAGLGDASARRAKGVVLLERALAAHPDNVAAATALTAQRTATEQPHELLTALRGALSRATERDAVLFLGNEVARIAREELHDVGVATLAMLRVQEVAPTDAPSLLTLAELYLAQRAWPEAVATLESVVAHATEKELLLTALFALGSIYEKVLVRPEEHERVLRAALAVEPLNPRALRGLIDPLRARLRALGPAPAGGAAPDEGRAATTSELVLLLRRLAKAEASPEKQSEAYLEVADLEADSGDLAAAERSLLDAIVHCPQSARAFARLSTFFRRESGLDAFAYARALQELISRGRDAGIADARWFAALGQLEVDTLQRLHEGVAHLEWAVQLDPTLHETRYELADAYAKTGAREAAVGALLGLISPDARPLAALADAGVALALLERLFEQQKRPGEAVVVSELRAFLGDLEPGRATWLKSRMLGTLEEHHAPLGRQALVESVLPKAGRHVLLEVAAASTGLEAKLLRTNVAELGLHARDRVGARSNHPLRPAFDRAVAALGVDDVELVVSPAIDRVRVVIQDSPWVLAPPSLEGLGFGVQVASLSRACARVLLGVPWLLELQGSAALGWLIAVARQVAPGYASDEPAPPEAATYERDVARAIGRRQRKLLDGLTTHLGVREGRPPELASFLLALDRCTARAAYLVSGDLTSTVTAIALEDRQKDAALARVNQPGLAALSAVLAHPVVGDAARFALTPEATALCQRVGSAWAR